MSVGSRIVDGTGKKYGARVTSDHALVVATTPYPEAGSTQDIVPFRQYFTSDGTASGTYDMRVNALLSIDDGSKMTSYGGKALHVNVGKEYWKKSKSKNILELPLLVKILQIPIFEKLLRF